MELIGVEEEMVKDEDDEVKEKEEEEEDEGEEAGSGLGDVGGGRVERNA